MRLDGAEQEVFEVPPESILILRFPEEKRKEIMEHPEGLSGFEISFRAVKNAKCIVVLFGEEKLETLPLEEMRQILKNAEVVDAAHG